MHAVAFSARSKWLIMGGTSGRLMEASLDTAGCWGPTVSQVPVADARVPTHETIFACARAGVFNPRFFPGISHHFFVRF